MANPVYRPLNVAVLQLADHLFPTGFDVGEDAPGTLEGLTDHIDQTGRMLVWSGACEGTIFDDAEVNRAFRAWHDFHHYRGRLPFTLTGEKVAAWRQIDDIRALYGDTKASRTMQALVYAEVVGQAEHFARTGEFPKDQREFSLAYIRSTSMPPGLRRDLAI